MNYSEAAHSGKLMLLIVENVNFVAHICLIELTTELVSTNTLAYYAKVETFIHLKEQQYDELIGQ